MSEVTNEVAAISPAHTAKVIRMSSVAEARELFKDIAGPVSGSAWVTQAINKVADATGLPHRRLRGIWGNEAKRIDSEEMDILREAARKEKANGTSLESFAIRIAALEARLAKIDPDFHREHLDRLGALALRIGREHQGDSGE